MTTSAAMQDAILAWYSQNGRSYLEVGWRAHRLGSSARSDRASRRHVRRVHQRRPRWLVSREVRTGTRLLRLAGGSRAAAGRAPADLARVLRTNRAGTRGRPQG